MAGQRVYEYLGFDWRLPLWDVDYINFWGNLDIKYKRKQRLYKEVIYEQNWANVWNKFPVNPNITFSIEITIIRIILKCFFAPIGQERWHAFELKYLDYYISNLCGYAPWNYFKVITDTRGFSSALSWHIEEYLNNKGLKWNGDYLKSNYKKLCK